MKLYLGIGDHHQKLFYLVTIEWPERATGPSKTPVSRWVSCFYSLVSIFVVLMYVLDHCLLLDH